MDECKVCANADNEYCFACDNGNQFKPMTNADIIRDMTDEKLTEFLLRRDLDAAKKLAEAAGFSITYDEQKCKEDILAWLKSPVEGGE